MSAVLERVSGIVDYSSKYADEVMRLAHAMHAESMLADIPLAEDKLRDNLAMAAVNPTVYCRLWLYEGEVVGGLYGMIGRPYWSHENMACDRAWFVTPGRRGSLAAVRLLRDFEGWAKRSGVRWITPGQTTGVRMEATRKLFEACGYRMRGFNFIKEL